MGKSTPQKWLGQKWLEHKWLEETFYEYEAPLIRYVRGIVGDLETSRDVVQDVFIKLSKQEANSFPRAEGVKVWLYKVSRNQSLDVLRKRKRVIVLADTEDMNQTSMEKDPLERIEAKERLKELFLCLDCLSPNQKEVILLKYQEGLSYAEISELTGLSSGNVGFLLHGGLKKLRTLVSADLLNKYQWAKSSKNKKKGPVTETL